MKRFLIVFSFFIGLKLVSQEPYKKLEDISELIGHLKSKVSVIKPSFSTILNYREEDWREFSFGNDIKFISISSEDSLTNYSEIYLTRNDTLVYAEESTATHFLSLDDVIFWNCAYLLESNRVLDYISLGHGKTEEDEWRPELIIDQWNARKAIYSKMKR
uniref:hypothetical protein n=1 Tax=Roseivirga sp. TaxID=1964215 RepID=UPI0040484E32